jgi:(2Fe-2S) ferredoxin
MGLEWTDEFLMKVSELTGKPIPESLAKERGRLVDMMTDSHAWLHGKKFALYGDTDFVMGMTKFLLELAVTVTGCLGSCSEGPNVLVYPEGVMYAKVRKDDVDEIVEQPLVQDRSVERLLMSEEFWSRMA